jgi:hypothetical protein
MKWTITGPKHRTNEPLRDYVMNGIFNVLTERERRFVVTLNQMMNHTTGECWPGNRLIEHLTGIRRDALRKATRPMRERGLLTTEMKRPKSGRPKTNRQRLHFVFWMPDNDPMCAAFRSRLREIAPLMAAKTVADRTGEPAKNDPAVRKSLAVGRSNGTDHKPNGYWPLIRRMRAMNIPTDEINAVAEFARSRRQGRPIRSIKQLTDYFNRRPWSEK